MHAVGNARTLTPIKSHDSQSKCCSFFQTNYEEREKNLIIVITFDASLNYNRQYQER